MVGAVLTTNLAILALGITFDYPGVLRKPAAEMVATFLERPATLGTWFTLLAVSAALLAPVAWLIGRLSSRPAMRWAVRLGVAAACVQVVGLARWPLSMPGLAQGYASATDPAAQAAALQRIESLDYVLGTLVGETLGYVLTAAWVVLVLRALGRAFAGSGFMLLGIVAAALISTGVLTPLDVPGAAAANLLGYVLWSVWMITFAVVLAKNASAARMPMARG